jgi:hypothetical protein
MRQLSNADRELLRFSTSFVNLRVRDFAELTGRSEHAVRERMPKLVIEHKTRFGTKKGELQDGLGLFYWLPNPSNPFEKVYFPTQKAWDTAHRLGILDVEVNATREKSEGQLEHDLVLTDFHKALHFAFKDMLKWSQLYQSRYTRWDDGTNDYVNADAVFSIVKPDGGKAIFFVEVENQKGVQEPLDKMRRYQRFHESGGFAEHFEHPDFRVIFLKPTPAMCTNALTAAAGERGVATRRFWFADYDAATLRIGEQIFRTPKDFESVAHSLLFV